MGEQDFEREIRLKRERGGGNKRGNCWKMISPFTHVLKLHDVKHFGFSGAGVARRWFINRRAKQ